ncbi:MAG: phosphomannomutase/phosphoglucomutase [Candidatus Magasanikbacteria bacterium]|nr:phosphomannomutase/phosphoglucomutase [Candidatus Magasanikbacteria bacterium]
MAFPSHIFKAYDIRGLADTELSPELAFRLGRAFVVFLRQGARLKDDQAAVVGRDMRPTSPIFAEAIIRGIEAEGVNVVDVGLVSTPLFNFACAHYPEYAGGIMVTASHNPAEYNGFKLTLGNGLPVGGQSGMGELRELVEHGQFPGVFRTGTMETRDVLPEYLKKVFSIVSPQAIRPLKIVIDAGNGMAKATFPEFLKALPVTVEYLFLEPDGSFPNHEANPLKVETLSALQRRVVATGADLGFALDGDADRIGLVDERGAVVDASFVGALVGLEVLRTHPKAHLLYDLRSSRIVPEVWQATGGEAEMSMVGHANIKKLMKENGAVFGSELSLHLYYHDMYDLESSDLSLLYILQFISGGKKPLSELIKPFQKYYHSGEINFEIADKAGAMKAIEEKYKNAALEITHLDGLWMKFDWGWFNVRASNTEPVLRLNLEAATEKTMKEKLAEVNELIK